MKKLLVIIALMLASASTTFALPGIDFGIFGGLSTPNDQIADIYSVKGTLSTTKVFEGAKSGFHIGAKVRVGLADNLSFVGSLAWHHFPETKTTLAATIPSSISTDAIDMPKSKQDIIPFTVGLNYTFMNAKIVQGYFVGDIAYNYFSNSLDVPAAWDSFVSASKTYGRVGAGLGVGFDINLIVMKLGIEGKYNFSNLIGKEDGESAKNYLSLSLGFYL